MLCLRCETLDDPIPTIERFLDRTFPTLPPRRARTTGLDTIATEDLAAIRVIYASLADKVSAAPDLAICRALDP
ncbi:hypothetical protein [Wenxinia marina]|uniref:Sulfotransferase family n=1 Tax=Wenxinia marina DSM 24838 TaxID=1123501 RepID=A0A0D0QK78_9RHOB|nr:hypothetical protein [Wenxinia marina]KIQ71413.1 Sulfotransferase family [Wenxinia marina DSM 24838]GGL78813.1 hypothetical protein GCM10011392_36600 [Wenxinia marina]